MLSYCPSYCTCSHQGSHMIPSQPGQSAHGGKCEQFKAVDQHDDCHTVVSRSQL